MSAIAGSDGYCSNCHKMILRPGVNYGVSPDAVCMCPQIVGFFPMSHLHEEIFRLRRENKELLEKLSRSDGTLDPRPMEGEKR